MPAAIAIGAISGGLGLIGAKMASNASKDAGRMQSDAAQQAAFRQQQATDQSLGYLEQSRAQVPSFQPSGAYGTLSRLMNMGGGGGAPQAGGAQGMPSPSPMTSVGSGQTPMAQGGTVLMRAPSGQTKAVPRHQVAHFQAKGAQVVG
jgi:hypothetical protein